MGNFTFRIGAHVVNPKVQGWGVGKILEDRGDGKFYVRFEGVGDKLMSAAFLEITDAPKGFSLPKKPIREPFKEKSSKTLIADYEGKVESRADEEAAKQIISSLVCDTVNVKLLMGQLLHSIDVATKIAPTAWSSTLFGNGFRLNVGPVEVLTFFGDELVVNMVGICEAGDIRGPFFEPYAYKAIQGPHCRYRGPLDRYREYKQAIEKPHGEFIRRAALRRSGTPREGTIWGSSHSDGLVVFAEKVCEVLDGCQKQ